MIIMVFVDWGWVVVFYNGFVINWILINLRDIFGQLGGVLNFNGNIGVEMIDIYICLSEDISVGFLDDIDVFVIGCGVVFFFVDEVGQFLEFVDQMFIDVFLKNFGLYFGEFNVIKEWFMNSGLVCLY